MARTSRKFFDNPEPGFWEESQKGPKLSQRLELRFVEAKLGLTKSLHTGAEMESFCAEGSLPTCNPIV